MTYEGFQEKVIQLIERKSEEISVEFHSGNGYFEARLSNGSTIIGNPSRDSVRIQWDNQRQTSRVFL